MMIMKAILRTKTKTPGIDTRSGERRKYDILEISKRAPVARFGKIQDGSQIFSDSVRV